MDDEEDDDSPGSYVCVLCALIEVVLCKQIKKDAADARQRDM